MSLLTTTVAGKRAQGRLDSCYNLIRSDKQTSFKFLTIKAIDG
jgi:hypothetical protein